MSFIVKCKNHESILIPNGVLCKKDDVYICPQSCSYKNSICAKNTTFSAKAAMPFDENNHINIHYLTYNQEEMASILKDEKLDSQIIENKPASVILETDSHLKNESALNLDGLAENTIDKYKMMLGNLKSPRQSAENANHEDQSSNNILKPTKEYKEYNVGGKIFSDLPEVKAKQITFPLKNALKEIFSYWITTAVFASKKELKDEFIWLICTTNKRKIKKDEVDNILSNEDYTISQKFFYLFYNIIFRYDPPQGFYWSDQRVSLNPLTFIFKDKEDFIKRYCDTKQRGEQFRHFFGQHEKEILHFLGCDNKEKLFEDMTLILAKKEKQIVFIDKDNKYIPINFGSISEFIQNMCILTELSNMKKMICFLEKYYISNSTVVRREPEKNPFEKSTDMKNNSEERYEEDVTMYQAAKLLSSANYATEYNCYMTLMKEYVKVFFPSEVTIGELHFTKSNFSAEIKNIIFEFCKAHFGEVDESVAKKLQGKAWLTKSIYERGILANFTCENSDQINSYLSLISPSHFKLINYYKTFSDPVFTFGKKDLTIYDYINQIIEAEDVYTASSEINNDERIKEYFSIKLKVDFEMELEKSFRAYQEQYDGFISK